MVRSPRDWQAKKVLFIPSPPNLTIYLICSPLYSMKDLAIEPAVRSHPDNPLPLPLSSTM